jgi:Thrombospondin type 3 repeat
MNRSKMNKLIRTSIVICILFFNSYCLAQRNIASNYPNPEDWLSDGTFYTGDSSHNYFKNSDRDGIPDIYDNCPKKENLNQKDKDLDGIGDACDNCPSKLNADQKDRDSDGRGDVCDKCPDKATGELLVAGAFPGYQADIDNDGRGDECDNCPNRSNADQADSDGDGVGDACDNCPSKPNADQKDRDSDGRGDVCDKCPDKATGELLVAGAPDYQPDSDGDGIGDECDNCPHIPNAGELLTAGASPGHQADSDGDGVGDACDNCPSKPNADQKDRDSDGRGDVCDKCPDKATGELLVAGASPGYQADIDNDGRGDECDNCPYISNADQADSDGEGLGDACDNCRNKRNADQIDTDDDGRGDVCDDELYNLLKISFPESIYLDPSDNPSLDKDLDGLKDDFENILADSWRPYFIFDQNENDRTVNINDGSLRFGEPTVLFQVRPIGGWDWPRRIVIKWAFLYRLDGGYRRDNLCKDWHYGDTESGYYELKSLDGVTWQLDSLNLWTEVPSIAANDQRIEWMSLDDTYWEKMSPRLSPIVHASAGKHHQYMTASNCEEEGAGWGECDDDCDGGAHVLADLLPLGYFTNVGEPDNHPSNESENFPFVTNLGPLGFPGEYVWDASYQCSCTAWGSSRDCFTGGLGKNWKASEGISGCTIPDPVYSLFSHEPLIANPGNS